MTALWMLFLSLLVTIDAASLGPKPVDIPVAIVYDNPLLIAREVPVTNDVGQKYAKVVEKPLSLPSGYSAALKNLQEKPQLSPEEIIEGDELNIPEYIARFAIGNDLESQSLLKNTETNNIQAVALDEPEYLKTVPELIENSEQLQINLDGAEQTDKENDITPNEQNQETTKEDTSEESNESSSSEESNESNNNNKVDEIKDEIKEGNENGEEMMIAQENNNMAENPQRKNTDLQQNPESQNNLETESAVQTHNDEIKDVKIDSNEDIVEQGKVEVTATIQQLPDSVNLDAKSEELEKDAPVEDSKLIDGSLTQTNANDDGKVEQNISLLKTSIVKNEQNAEISSTESASTTQAQTTQKPIRPFIGIQNVINRIGESALNVLLPNNNNNKPIVNREGETSSTTAAPQNLIEGFQSNINTQMHNFAGNVHGFFDRFRDNNTQSDEGSPPSRPLLDAIETQFDNGFNSFQNTVNNAINFINPNAQSNGTQSDEQPPNAVVGAIQNGLATFQQTFTNAVQSLRPNQTQSDEAGNATNTNFPQQVMNIFQTSVQNFMANFNGNRGNNTQNEESTPSPNPISSFIGAISNVFGGNQNNPIQQVSEAAQNIPGAANISIPQNIPTTLPVIPGAPNLQEQISLLQNASAIPLPNPSDIQLPNPGNVQLPNPANIQLPNPANIQLPTPSEIQLPGSSQPSKEKQITNLEDDSSQPALSEKNSDESHTLESSPQDSKAIEEIETA